MRQPFPLRRYALLNENTGRLPVEEEEDDDIDVAFGSGSLPSPLGNEYNRRPETLISRKGPRPGAQGYTTNPNGSSTLQGAGGVLREEAGGSGTALEELPLTPSYPNSDWAQVSRSEVERRGDGSPDVVPIVQSYEDYQEKVGLRPQYGTVEGPLRSRDLSERYIQRMNKGDEYAPQSLPRVEAITGSEGFLRGKMGDVSIPSPNGPLSLQDLRQRARDRQAIAASPTAAEMSRRFSRTPVSVPQNRHADLGVRINERWSDGRGGVNTQAFMADKYEQFQEAMRQWAARGYPRDEHPRFQEGIMPIMRSPDGKYAGTSWYNIEREGGPLTSRQAERLGDVILDDEGNVLEPDDPGYEEGHRVSAATDPSLYPAIVRQRIRRRERNEELGGIPESKLRRIQRRQDRLQKSVRKGIISQAEADRRIQGDLEWIQKMAGKDLGGPLSSKKGPKTQKRSPLTGLPTPEYRQEQEADEERLRQPRNRNDRMDRYSLDDLQRAISDSTELDPSNVRVSDANTMDELLGSLPRETSDILGRVQGDDRHRYNRALARKIRQLWSKENPNDDKWTKDLALRTLLNQIPDLDLEDDEAVQDWVSQFFREADLPLSHQLKNHNRAKAAMNWWVFPGQ